MALPAQSTATALAVTGGAPLAPATHEPPNPAAVYLARLGVGSRRTMRQALEVVAELLGAPGQASRLPWGQVRYEHAQAVRARLADKYAPATANKVLAALRGVLREAWRLGLLGAEDMQRAVDLAPVRGVRLPAGQHVQPAALLALTRTCQNGTPGGARDLALLALLAAGGLRRAEVAALDLADLEPVTGALTVRGKGDKQRLAYLAPEALAAVLAWVAVRGNAPGPLLLPVRLGVPVMRRLSTQCVYSALERLARHAKVPPLTPHDLRRTFAGSLLDAGADLAAVSKLMGHASVSTTARYDRRGEGAKRAAAARLHFPYAPELGQSGAVAP